MAYYCLLPVNHLGLFLVSKMLWFCLPNCLRLFLVSKMLWFCSPNCLRLFLVSKMLQFCLPNHLRLFLVSKIVGLCSSCMAYSCCLPVNQGINACAMMVCVAARPKTRAKWVWKLSYTSKSYKTIKILQDLHGLLLLLACKPSQTTSRKQNSRTLQLSLGLQLLLACKLGH